MSKMPVHVRYGRPRPTVSAHSLTTALRAALAASPSTGDLVYGQIRESPNGRKFLMLAPVPTDTWMWSTVVLTGHDTNSIGPVWRMSATWLAKWPVVEAP